MSFEDRYGELYTRKIEHLSRRLLEYETGEGHIVVLPLEAGIGKSIQTDLIIGNYLSEAKLISKQRRFLIVKKFSEDVYKSAARINEAAGRKVALGITKDEWKEVGRDVDTLWGYPVLIITHERYLRLCKNDYDRTNICQDRHTLVLDEAVNLSFPTFSEKRYKDVLGWLPWTLEHHHSKVCKPLLHEMSLLKERHKGHNSLVTLRVKFDHEALLSYKKAVEANVTNFKLYQNYADTMKFIEDLQCLGRNICVFNNGRLSCVDDVFTLWGLSNNLILDANGSIDRQYRFDPTVKIDAQTTILTHENWTLHRIPVNASTSSIKRTSNYHQEVCRALVERKRKTDKTLVVTQNEMVPEVERLLQESGVTGVDVAYFGNLIGKNNWRDYNQVWVIATPNYRMDDYALLWASVTCEDLSSRDLSFVASKGKLRFLDPEIEQIRMGRVVSEMYQAIKRINRDNTQDAEVFVACADDAMFGELRVVLKGIKYAGEIRLDVKKKDGTPKRKTQGEQLAALLSELPAGENLPKALLCDELGLDKKNFSRYTKDAKVQSVAVARGITWHHKTFHIAR